MKVRAIIDEFRGRVDDTVGNPYLVSDKRVIGFLNHAEQEAARRARLLVDSTTPELCRIPISANVPTYPLDPRVIFVRRPRLEGRSAFLTRRSHKDLDPRGSGWMDETGEPHSYVPDLDSRRFRPYPMPEENGLVWLTVVRLPLRDMVKEDDQPELPAHLHMGLIDWMEYRFYSIPDTQMRDKKKADEALARFEIEFGKPSTAIEEAWIEQHQQFGEDEGQF